MIKEPKEQGGYPILLYNFGKVMLKKRAIPLLAVLDNFHVITRIEQLRPHTQRLPDVLRDGASAYKVGFTSWLAGRLEDKPLVVHVFGACLTCHRSSMTSAWNGSLKTQLGIFHFSFTSFSKKAEDIM